MDLINKLIKTYKEASTKKKLLYLLAIGASAYMLLKGRKKIKIPKTKLSYFLIELSQNMITEAIIKGNKIAFKTANSDNWLKTDASVLTNDRIFKLLEYIYLLFHLFILQFLIS